jgi:hypothetical protein
VPDRTKIVTNQKHNGYELSISVIVFAVKGIFNLFFQSAGATGLAAFALARHESTFGNNETIATMFHLQNWLSAWSASAFSANRDGVNFGHNFYTITVSNSSWYVTVDDVDRSLGQQPSGKNSSVQFPALLCTPPVPWCGGIVNQFRESYFEMLSSIWGSQGYYGSGAMGVDVQSLDATAAQFRHNQSERFASQIENWCAERVLFLKQQRNASVE